MLKKIIELSPIILTMVYQAENENPGVEYDVYVEVNENVEVVIELVPKEGV